MAREVTFDTLKIKHRRLKKLYEILSWVFPTSMLICFMIDMSGRGGGWLFIAGLIVFAVEIGVLLLVANKIKELERWGVEDDNRGRDKTDKAESEGKQKEAEGDTDESGEHDGNDTGATGTEDESKETESNS